MRESPSFEVIGFVKQDRSGRVRWLLEELGLQHSSRFLDWESNEHESPEYLRLNPLGVVPTLMIDGQPLFESGAICLYLVDRFGAGKALAPDATSGLRAEFLQWFFFATSTLDAKLNELGMARHSSPENPRIGEIASELRDLCQVVERRFEDRDYLVGNEFSVADIVAGNCLAWSLSKELEPVKFPRLAAYVERLRARRAVVASGAIKPA